MSEAILTNEIYKRLNGGACPVCGKWFEPNGTGDEGAEFTHWALSKLPWDDILQDEAVPVHDWRCHIGEFPTNISFEETTAEFKSNVETAIYRWCYKPWRWWRRPLYKIAFRYIDEVYAYAVGTTQRGRDAFDSDSCVNI